MPFLIAGWDEVVDWVLTHGLRILLIASVLTIAYLAFRLAFPRLVRGVIFRDIEKPDEELKRRAHTLTAAGIRIALLVTILLALITTLAETGINIAALLTGLGITGLAIALGAQALVRDGINGIFILAEDQYRVGDTVKVSEVQGIVEDISLRRTLVRDMDGVLHSIPNSAITIVANYTRGYARVSLDLRVAYGEDLARVTAIVEEVGRELAADPAYKEWITEAPKVSRIEDVNEAGVTLKVLGTTRPGRQWDVASELRRRIMSAFLAQGVRVPFPPHVMVAGSGP